MSGEPLYPKITLRCDCGRRLGHVRTYWLDGDGDGFRSGVLDVEIRPGHGDDVVHVWVPGDRRWQLRCPRHRPQRTYPLTAKRLAPRVRRAMAHGRRELTLGVDL